MCRRGPPQLERRVRVAVEVRRHNSPHAPEERRGEFGGIDIAGFRLDIHQNGANARGEQGLNDGPAPLDVVTPERFGNFKASISFSGWSWS